MPEDIRTSTLTNENNRIVDSINSKRNIFIGSESAPGPIPRLRSSFGFSKPIQLSEAQSLTKQQQALVLKSLGSALIAIAENIANRDLEANLIAGGFTSILDAISQAPTLIGSKSGDVVYTLEKTVDMYNITDSFVDAELIYRLMSGMDSIETALVNAANTVSKV